MGRSAPMPRPSIPESEKLRKRSFTMNDRKFLAAQEAARLASARMGVRLTFSAWVEMIVERETAEEMRLAQKPPGRPGRR